MSDTHFFQGGDAGTSFLSDNFKSDFWEHVKRVLREVFAGDEALVVRLRAIVDGAATEIQTAFYDLEPFAVAVDLSKALHRRH